MANITATKAGNWSDTSVWDLGRVPANGDDVLLAGFVVVWDTSITTIPATGTLASITSTGTAGQVTLALDNAAFHGGATLNCTTITAGALATTGIIATSGSTDHVLTINCTTITGGGSGDYGVYHNSTGTLTIVGNLVGGSNATGYAVYNATSGVCNITGNISGGTGGPALYNGTGTINVYQSILTGGSVSSAYAIVNAGTTAVTLHDDGTGCNLINSTACVAVAGRTVVWEALATNYIQFGTTKYAKEPSATNIKSGVTVGTVTGTYTGTGGGGMPTKPYSKGLY